MKTTMLKNVALGLLAMIAFTVLSVLLTPAIAGVAVAMAGVATTGTVTEQMVRATSETLDMEDISKKVIEILPSRTPIDTILRQIRAANKAEAMEHRYYEVSTMDVSDIPDADANGAGTSSSVPAKEYTYSTGAGLTSIFISVTNEACWSVNDTILMRGLTLPVGADGVARLGESTSTRKEDVAFFVSYKSGSVLRLTPLNGVLGLVANVSKFVVPNFTSTTVLYRMGRAQHELDMVTSAHAMLPDYNTQYAQFFMAMVQESVFQQMTKKEVAWGFQDYERHNLLDMKRGMEKSFLWGAKGRTINPDKTEQTIYTTDGITRRITNSLTYGTGGTNRTISFDNLINWAKTIFVGNNGSDSRYLFAGADLIGALHSVETVQKQINGKSPFVNWGLKFTDIQTNFGNLYVYHHPIFDESGWGDNGLILDFEHIQKHDFLPMGVYDLDLQKAGTSRSNARVISEASFLTLTNPACHGIIAPRA